MDLALFGGRALLAIVFTVAGIAKLRDRSGSRKAVQDFGVPPRLAAPLAAILPVLELVIAVALIPSSSAHWAALAAFVLLILFSLAIVINLARGKQPDCHCFGQLHSSPVGSSTLVRNGVLAAVAGFIAWQGWTDPTPSATTWLGRLSTAEAIGLAAAIGTVSMVSLQGWFLLHLLRQHGRLLVRMDALEVAVGRGVADTRVDVNEGAAGLPVGSEAPEFALAGLHGETVTLAALRSAGKPVMLLFTAPGCGPCESLMPEVSQWQQDRTSALSIALISAGPTEAVAALARQHGLRNVLRQDAWEVAESYRYLGTPSAVVVSADGRIATALVGGPDAIRSLYSHSLGGLRPVPVEFGRANGNGHDPHHGNGHGSHHHRPSAVPQIGEAAPTPQLLDLDGRTQDLGELLGEEETLVLFWNPGCGFCEQMLDDLKAWEDQPPDGAPKLVVISAGSVEANKAMGLRSPVLLDQRSQAMEAFGASGTPMAVRVDAEGRIASALAVGASAVLALAREQPNNSDKSTFDRDAEPRRHG